MRELTMMNWRKRTLGSCCLPAWVHSLFVLDFLLTGRVSSPVLPSTQALARACTQAAVDSLVQRLKLQKKLACEPAG